MENRKTVGGEPLTREEARGVVAQNTVIQNPTPHRPENKILPTQGKLSDSSCQNSAPFLSSYHPFPLAHSSFFSPTSSSRAL